MFLFCFGITFNSYTDGGQDNPLHLIASPVLGRQMGRSSPECEHLLPTPLLIGNPWWVRHPALCDGESLWVCPEDGHPTLPTSVVAFSLGRLWWKAMGSSFHWGFQEAGWVLKLKSLGSIKKIHFRPF